MILNQVSVTPPPPASKPSPSRGQTDDATPGHRRRRQQASTNCGKLAESLDEQGRPYLEGSAELRRRTLTNLYNQNPTWLQNTHAELDAAVAAAYGWPPDLPEAEILTLLLDLNLKRAAS